jgi:hypothetical protein
MKRFLTLLIGLILGFGIHAQQVDRDMVIFEGGTGFW